MACALGDTQSQAWALDAFIVQQCVPSSPIPSALLMCGVLVVVFDKNRFLAKTLACS